MHENNTRKLGQFIWFGYQIPIPERVKLIKQAGFETVLHWWDDSFVEKDGFSKEEQVDIIRAGGLFIENAHLPYESINDIWLDTRKGQELLDLYLSDIDGLADYEIPVAVFHLTRGLEPPPATDIGMNRIHRLIEKAENRGVKIAVENVTKNQNLEVVLSTFDSPMLGFCYDSGHDYAWSETPYTILDKYKDRLFAVHLHDNMGEKDEHSALGEGMIDWSIVRNGIERSAYNGSYTLESDKVVSALQTPFEYLKIHYESACKYLL